LIETYVNIKSLDLCYKSCQLKPGCEYYVWYQDAEACDLYLQGDVYYDCDVIRGPAQPSYADVRYCKMCPFKFVSKWFILDL